MDERGDLGIYILDVRKSRLGEGHPHVIPQPEASPSLDFPQGAMQRGELKCKT
jgi:hypothetical protein